jgi:hypothetical protein
VEKWPVSGGIQRFLPMIAMLAAILVAASLPGRALPFLRHHQLDKICHALAYAALAASCLFAFQPLLKKTSLSHQSDGDRHLSLLRFCGRGLSIPYSAAGDGQQGCHG